MEARCHDVAAFPLIREWRSQNICHTLQKPLSKRDRDLNFQAMRDQQCVAEANLKCCDAGFVTLVLSPPSVPTQSDVILSCQAGSAMSTQSETKCQQQDLLGSNLTVHPTEIAGRFSFFRNTLAESRKVRSNFQSRLLLLAYAMHLVMQGVPCRHSKNESSLE